jgi:hypothetical protein
MISGTCSSTAISLKEMATVEIISLLSEGSVIDMSSAFFVRLKKESLSGLVLSSSITALSFSMFVLPISGIDLEGSSHSELNCFVSTVSVFLDPERFGTADFSRIADGHRGNDISRFNTLWDAERETFRIFPTSSVKEEFARPMKEDLDRLS